MRQGRFDPAQALAHPLWWTALMLLILNDHLLKGSGWLDAALTGKLSDFAGLTVAPAVLSLLLGARGRRAVLVCAGAVLCGFTLIKVSSTAADLLVRALSRVSTGAQICSDPTDLWALPMLWLGVHVQRDAGLGATWLHRAPLRRAAFSVGLLACMATTESHKFASSAVVNHRAAPLRVRVREVWVDCASFDADDAGSLTTGDFAQSWAGEVGPQEHMTLIGACGAAWVTIPNAYDGVIAWDHLSAKEPPDEITQWFLDRSLVAEGTRAKIKVTPGKHLHAFPRPRVGKPTLELPDGGAFTP